MPNKKNSKEEELQAEQLTEEVAAEEAVAAEEEAVELSEADLLRNELADMKENYLRQVAEFDNYRKRVAKEKEDTYSFALVKCITEFLPVMDNFERALACKTEDQSYKKGVEMIYQQLNEMLNKLGVSEIEAAGQPFDPKLHNAVSQREDDAFGENIVCEVFQKGYQIGDKVVRHAMVVVANP